MTTMTGSIINNNNNNNNYDNEGGKSIEIGRRGSIHDNDITPFDEIEDHLYDVDDDENINSNCTKTHATTTTTTSANTGARSIENNNHNFEIKNNNIDDDDDDDDENDDDDDDDDDDNDNDDDWTADWSKDFSLLPPPPPEELSTEVQVEVEVDEKGSIAMATVTPTATPTVTPTATPKVSAIPVAVAEATPTTTSTTTSHSRPTPTTALGSTTVANISTRFVAELNRYQMVTIQMGIPEELMPLLGYALSSFIFLLSTLTHNEDLGLYFGYSLSIGIIGLIMSVGLIICIVGCCCVNNQNKSKQSNTGNNNTENENEIENGLEVTQEVPSTQQQQHEHDTTESVIEKYRWVINPILFVWALFGVLVLTMDANATFNETGNGYFSIWAMLLSAFWNYGVTIEYVEQELLSSADSCIYGLGLTSFVLIIELVTIVIYANNDAGNDLNEFSFSILVEYRHIYIYVMILSVFSILYSVFTAGYSRLTSDNVRFDPKKRFIFVTVFAILWIIAACLSTFIGPFTSTGNGYFAAWGSVVCTVFAIIDIRQEIARLYI